MNSVRKFILTWHSKIILKTLPIATKTIFRKYEKSMSKLVTLRAHLLFNETCKNNELLPIYTNIRLHNEATRHENFVLDFRKDLIDNEIKKQIEEISTITAKCDQIKKELQEDVNSAFRFESLSMFLQSILQNLSRSLYYKHTEKLTKLHGSPLLLKQQPDSVINLSNLVLDEETKDILNIGMNCHLKTKYDMTRKKIEIEKLYTQIVNEKN